MKSKTMQIIHRSLKRTASQSFHKENWRYFPAVENPVPSDPRQQISVILNIDMHHDTEGIMSNNCFVGFNNQSSCRL